MSSVHRITALDDPRAGFFRDLKGQHPRLSASGLILIEGEDQLQRAVACGVGLKVLFCEEEFWKQFSGSAHPELEVLLGERELLEQIVGYRLHRGRMALAERPVDTKLAEIEFPALALNEVTDPENVGDIARSAAAFGFRTLIFDRASSDPFSRRAIRVSMGGVFGLKICPVESIEALFAADQKVFAVECGGDWPAAWPDPADSILLLGNEKRGLPREIQRRCAGVITIPMRHELLSSINVGTAAGIVCAEMFRRSRAAT